MNLSDCKIMQRYEEELLDRKEREFLVPIQPTFNNDGYDSLTF